MKEAAKNSNAEGGIELSRAAPDDLDGSSTSQAAMKKMFSSLWARAHSHPRFRTGLVLTGAVLFIVLAGTAWAIIEGQKVAVPDLVGLSVIEGETVANDLELLVEPSSLLPPRGIRYLTSIASQEPAAGDRVFPGTVVTFGFEMVEVVVPDTEGMSLTAALKALSAEGLTGKPTDAQLVRLELDDLNVPGVSADADPAALAALVEKLGLTDDVDLTGRVFSLTGAGGYDEWAVTRGQPAGGESVLAGSTVELTLALPITQVPNVLGMPTAQASELLKEVGLKAGRISEPSFAGPLPEGFQLDLAYLKYSYWGGNEGTALAAKVGTPESWPIASQSLAPGEVVLVGDAVDIGAEWPASTVPDLSGKTNGEAKQALSDNGLSGKDLPFSATGIVRNQTYSAGTVLPMGARVGAEVRHEFSFSVTSSASTGMVTWAAPGSFSIQQANGASLPWVKSWYPSSIPDRYVRGTFSAQMDSWDGWITCEMIADGKVVQTNTSTGAFAAVSCG